MLHVSDLVRIGSRQVARQHRKYAGVIAAIALGTLGFIVVVTTGRDVKANLNRDLDLLGGATMIRVGFEKNHMYRAAMHPSTLTDVATLPGVAGIAVSATRMGQASSHRLDKEFSFTTIGVSETFWDVNGYVASKGILFTPDDVAQRRRVCVLGAELAHKIFGNTPPVGEYVQIDNDLYRVTGTLEGPGVHELTLAAFLPLTTALDRLPYMLPVDRIYVRCRTWDDVEPVAALLPGTVGLHQATDRLLVDVAREPLKQIRRIVWWVQVFIVIAIIATLTIGGFGIWNGMITAVRTRTREIGLKKAMGAENGDILRQFLAEAICLSLGSSLLGAIASRGAIAITARLLDSAPPEPLFFLSLGLSIVFAVIIGVAAGYYPALEASRMDVVSAMKYE